jgi:hypothetical protein
MVLPSPSIALVPDRSSGIFDTVVFDRDAAPPVLVEGDEFCRATSSLRYGME